MSQHKDYSKELEVMLLFEEMQELNFFLESPEKCANFATLRRQFEEQELLRELNQTDDSLQHESNATNRRSTGGSS